MTADLSALIARLEAAEAGSRELDGAIHRATSPDDLLMADSGSVGRNPRPARRQPLRECGFVSDRDLADMMGSPSVTTTIDAAVAFAERVLGDAFRLALVQRPDTSWDAATLWLDTDPNREVEYGHAPTPALALVIAVLRAKAQEG